MRDVSPEVLDRLLAGELSRSEERRLAQQALVEPELFDSLTAAAIAKHALEPSVAASRWSARRLAVMAAGLAAAAVLVLAVASTRVKLRGVPAPRETPTAAVAAPIASPILLAARVDVSAQTFRADTVPSRQPRESGAITDVRDDSVDVDLGSLDGLAQGTTMRLVRDGRPVGRVAITTVFRERARARPESNVSARTGDSVEVDASVHVAALLNHAAARRAAGDVAAARDLANRALARARSDAVPADLRRRALFELATLERQRGDLDAAARFLQADLEGFDASPAAAQAERGDVLNELGVVQIERRELAAAERALESAVTIATGATRMRAANNLGAIAALRGDRAAAEQQYRAAGALAVGAPQLAADREAIAKNLAALGAFR